ncbi:uncharacterized protein TNCV_4704941 [Trichonephila clavipes]|nr:uncharacterized protein TNCV_4704941 [Trichonephila clavipes]
MDINCNADLEKAKKDFSDDRMEEITDFVQSTPGFQECVEEDVETWMACDAEDCRFQTMLNDDEIATSKHEESDPVNDVTDENEDNNNNESSKGPSNAGRVFCVEWYEQKSERCPTQLLLLKKKRIKDLAAKKRRLFINIRKRSYSKNISVGSRNLNQGYATRTAPELAFYSPHFHTNPGAGGHGPEFVADVIE